MKSEHFSFRGGMSMQERNFLHPTTIDKMVSFVNQKFDPYGSYHMDYEILHMDAVSTNNENLNDSTYYVGALSVDKGVDNDVATYRVTREVCGLLNRRNSAKPLSISRYLNTAKNDLLCTITSDSVLEYEYEVKREYYNDELPSIYEVRERLFVDDDHYVYKGGFQKPYRIGEIENNVFTDFTLMDAIQKITISDDAQDTSLVFDYLESMEVLKTNHHVTYMDTINVQIGDKTHHWVGYCHTGLGILPNYYWVTENGILVFVRYGTYYLVLAGGNQRE